MKRKLYRRMLGIAAMAGGLLLSGVLTSCDVMLEDMSSCEVKDLLGNAIVKAEDFMQDQLPVETDAMPDEDIDPDYSYAPVTEGIPCDEIVTEPPTEIPLPDVDINGINYYATEEETGLSFTGGYVDSNMYLYGILDPGMIYVKHERWIPGVQVIDSYEEFRTVFNMTRREFVTNARNTEAEEGTESTFWTQLSRMTPGYFDEWSLIVVLTPDAVEPFVNNDVRTYPIVSGCISADVTAIDLRTTAALYDKPEAAYAVMIPLYKGLNNIVAEDIVLGYDGALFLDKRFHERAGDELSRLLLNFDTRITEAPTWPVVKEPTVSAEDVIAKSRIEDGILHAFLPEDPQIFGSDRIVFWVNSADDIPRYLGMSDNENIREGLGLLEGSPAYDMLQSYLDVDEDFFEDQWLVLILLREDSWSVSYDASVTTEGRRTDIQIDPVTSDELDNRRAFWLLAVAVDAGNDYYVTINNSDGSRDTAAYYEDRIASSIRIPISD